MSTVSFDSTRRFSNRVADYVRYRPGYPAAVVTDFAARFGLSAGQTVADVGCGTGLFAAQLLRGGFHVIGVEPNEAMRQAGDEYLRDEPRFTSRAGTAEETGLPDSSVAAVVMAQAFHWCDGPRTRREFQRVLRSGGPVALIWNARQTRGCAFLEDYEAHLRKHGIDYQKIRHQGLEPAAFEAFYGHTDFGPEIYANEQELDYDGFRGRHFSSSYTPAPDHPGRAAAERDLERLFATHQREERVTIRYDTKVYRGRLA